MTTVTISPEGQLAIPQAVSEQLKLEAGTQVSIDVQGDSVVVRRMPADLPDWRTMQGMVRGGESLTKALEEEHREELAREDAKFQNR
jgi:AbrB family looped-hinge helix DNA binding protein